MKKRQTEIACFDRQTQHKKGVITMSKKTHSIAKVLSCMMLAAVFAVCLVMPALALDYVSGTPSSPAEAVLSKIYKMPVNTPTPKADFVFSFIKVGMGLNTPADTTNKDKMPALKDLTISFAAGEEPQKGTFVAGDTKSVVKESANILAGITSDDWGNGEGIYRYKVYENSDKSKITLAGAENEDARYSSAQYDVEIWVEEYNGTLYAKYICVKIDGEHKDEYYEGTPGGTKVDPTPGGVKESNDFTIDDDFSQVYFTNKYWVSDGGGTTDPSKSALDILKKLAGDDADPTRLFDFDVTVWQPSLVDSAQTYKAYIRDKDGNNITSQGNFANFDASGATVVVDGKTYILFPSGTEVSGIKLLGDQKLVFVDLHVGSTVKAFEAAAGSYKPSYKRTFSTTTEFTAENANMAYGFPRQGDLGPHYLGAGTNANVATFTNRHVGATPTGINVDDLPYIALIAIAVIALFVAVMFKFRKNNRYE